MTSYKHVHKAMCSARNDWMHCANLARIAHAYKEYKSWSYWMRRARMHKQAYKTLATGLHWVMYMESMTQVLPHSRNFNSSQLINLVDYYYPSMIRPQAN